MGGENITFYYQSFLVLFDDPLRIRFISLVSILHQSILKCSFKHNIHFHYHKIMHFVYTTIGIHIFAVGKLGKYMIN